MVGQLARLQIREDLAKDRRQEQYVAERECHLEKQHMAVIDVQWQPASQLSHRPHEHAFPLGTLSVTLRQSPRLESESHQKPPDGVQGSPVMRSLDPTIARATRCGVSAVFCPALLESAPVARQKNKYRD